MPAKRYKNAAGKVIPSFSSIRKKYGDPGGLLHWAWNEGWNGRDYRETRNKAADIGGYCHEAIEADIKGLPYDVEKIPFPDEDKQRVVQCLKAWNEWKRSVRFELVGSEVELVSELYQYGGTLDIVARIQDKYAIMDVKTGKAYESALYQGAAYQQLWNENNSDKMIDTFYLILLGKEDGSFKWNYYPELDNAWTVFKNLRQLYDAAKVVEKQV